MGCMLYCTAEEASCSVEGCLRNQQDHGSLRCYPVSAKHAQSRGLSFLSQQVTRLNIITPLSYVIVSGEVAFI